MRCSPLLHGMFRLAHASHTLQSVSCAVQLVAATTPAGHTHCPVQVLEYQLLPPCCAARAPTHNAAAAVWAAPAWQVEPPAPAIVHSESATAQQHPQCFRFVAKVVLQLVNSQEVALRTNSHLDVPICTAGLVGCAIWTLANRRKWRLIGACTPWATW